MASDYDLNVYIVDGVLNLTAYEQLYDDSSNPEPCATNNEKFTILPIPIEPAYDRELTYLLGEDWVKSRVEDWQDYDEWEDLKILATPDTPLILSEWAKGLPPYEPEIEHQWEDFNKTIPAGGTLLLHCLTCEAVSTWRQPDDGVRATLLTATTNGKDK